MRLLRAAIGDILAAIAPDMSSLQIVAPENRLMAARQWLTWRVSGRGLVFVLVAMIVFVPTLARVHQHIGSHPTDEAPRFRWSTSCESVPKKATVVAVTDIVAIVGGVVHASKPASYMRPATEALPRVAAVISPHGLRAPPPPIA